MLVSTAVMPSTLRYWVGDGSSEYSQGLVVECPSFTGSIYLFVKREERRALATALREASDAIRFSLDMEGLTCNPT